jgi:hypothetical protein
MLAGLVVSRMRERRGCLAADNRGSLVDEFVILEGFHHKQGKVYSAREVTFENGITYVPTPNGQTLARAFFIFIN